MASKKNVTRVIISIIFIAYGISSVFTAFHALLDLDLRRYSWLRTWLADVYYRYFRTRKNTDKGMPRTWSYYMHTVCA